MKLRHVKNLMSLDESLFESANRYTFRSVHPEYTGGNIYVFNGRVGKDWFIATDDEYSVRLVDANPISKDAVEQSGYADWQEQHLIKDLSYKESLKFFKEMLNWVLSKNPRGNYSRDELASRAKEVDKLLKDTNESINESVNSYIKEYSLFTPEHKKLDAMATILSSISPNRFQYFVDDTYFDYGQNWKWTTILAKQPNGDVYQALSPAQQARIIMAGAPNGDVAEYIKDPQFETIARDILDDAWVDKKLTEALQHLDEASYGGAFDIEDDQYFTRDDLTEFGEELIDRMKSKTGRDVDVISSYIDDNNLEVTVVENDTENEATHTEHIDMRKIRMPKDLNKYIDRFIDSFEDEFRSYENDLTEDLEVMEGPTQEEYGISSIINQAIKDTFSLIDTYNSYSINCGDQGFEDIANKFNELNTELNSHVGTLQNMLKEVSPNAEAIDGSAEEVFEIEESLDEGVLGDIAKTAWSGIKNIKAVKDTSSAIKNIKKQIQDSPSYQAAKKTWQQTETGKKQQAEREVKQLEDTKNKLYQDIDKLTNKDEVKKILPQIRAYIQNDNVSEEDAENIISALQNKGKSLGVNVKTQVNDAD